jgi:hypothetical protein
VSRPRRFKLIAGLCLGVGVGLLAYAGLARDDWIEKRVSVVEAGRLVRGAWQRPGPLRKIIARERIKTIVTLTAINSSDPKFIDQERVVRETGIGWMIIPMRGSRATAEQMALAADLLADPARQPFFFIASQDITAPAWPTRPISFGMKATLPSKRGGRSPASRGLVRIRRSIATIVF